MSPDRFDDLTRLWASASSRRVFVLEVGALLVASALGKVSVRVPRWMWAEDPIQCLPGSRHREGMPCGGQKKDVKSCGVCQNATCVPRDTTCQGRNKCGHCDPTNWLCTDKCPKDQQCCTDGCCDGACTKEGACCPKARQCGKDKELCCGDCEDCVDDVCKKQPAKEKCPGGDWQLTKEGCCVCPVALCGGECCDKPCVKGKCCDQCGLDGAICCDGRKCCRERCVDPEAAAKCCDCWEDISEKEAKDVLARANALAKKQQEGKIPYKQDAALDPNLESPPYMDCSYFVQKALGVELLADLFNKKPKPERLSTRVLDGTCRFRRLNPNEPPRAGDLVAQPRDDGAPGSQHVGVATGVAGAKGGHVGIAMGNGDSNAGSTSPTTWGLEKGNGGSFKHGDQMRTYRPQKLKPNCSPTKP